MAKTIVNTNPLGNGLGVVYREKYRYRVYVDNKKQYDIKIADQHNLAI